VTALPSRPAVGDRATWHLWFSELVRLAIAPLLLFSSGFFTANFLISGHYTWPRTSRVFVLTVTLAVLAYEFVYKDRLERTTSHERALQALLYSCLVPYAAGAFLTLALLSALRG
jgi:hypothetical protein